ncbi:MAG: PilN domain-containing protein [Deltaproteobacteria bacterium]|nr:PilN domain-containing protein [Deltaproteobacteria bacterium]
MALREINLVPNDILDRRHLRRHVCFWTACLTVSVFLICGFYFCHAHLFLSKNRAPATLKDLHSHLGTSVEEIERIQDELDSLSQQQAVLATITRNQSYYKVLLKLADIMNECTWLTQLAIDSSKEEEDNAGLKLTGVSFSNEELGNFLNQLTNEPMFNTVVLNYAKETNMAQLKQKAGESVKLVQFEVECNLSRNNS